MKRGEIASASASARACVCARGRAEKERQPITYLRRPYSLALSSMAAVILLLSGGLGGPIGIARAQGQAGQGDVIQDCSTQYQYASDLSNSLQLEYTVYVPGISDSGGGDVAADSGAGEGYFRARLTHRGGISWVAFATSPGGTMPNSDAVIGIPDGGVGGSGNGSVQKYRLGGYDLADIRAVSGDVQTLRNQSIVVTEDGSTVLTYEKLLVEPNEHTIVSSGTNTFIWAMGQDGSTSLGYHGYSDRGDITLTLNPCVPGSGIGSAQQVVAGGTAKPDERQWRWHGLMALVGWGFLTPVAVAASWCRDIIGRPLWFKIHMAFNSVTAVLSVALFAVAVDTFRRNGRQHFQGGLPSSSHLKLGLAMFVLVCVQATGGFARPHLPPPPVAKPSPSSSEEDAADKAETGRANARNEAPSSSDAYQKAKVRVVWEYMHKLSGEALLFLSMYQIYTGLDIYEDRGYDVFITRTAYWAWIGTFLGLSFVLALWNKFYSARKMFN